MHREQGLLMENNIRGIQLKSTKSQSVEDVGESTRLDVQLEFSEIHVCVKAYNMYSHKCSSVWYFLSLFLLFSKFSTDFSVNGSFFGKLAFQVWRY